MCGRSIEQLKDPTDKKPLPRRWWGSLKFIQYCLRATRVIAEFDQRFRQCQLKFHEDSLSMQAEMDGKFRWLLEAGHISPKQAGKLAAS